MGRHIGVGFWPHWLRTPAWIWTYSVLPVRLANVAMAVGSVYVSYRIGTTMRDRATGRLAAALLTVTWGFLILAHEGVSSAAASRPVGRSRIVVPMR
jgi:4-amino-4-deoxy-L-arabinose transferase-like glycosyltransferase